MTKTLTFDLLKIGSQSATCEDGKKPDPRPETQVEMHCIQPKH